ncbi:MAG: HTTM domain-containing protein, partial [Myxococcales bacterium]|nr:HTTM domain-containing protein [Myxococcales bacterium]
MAIDADGTSVVERGAAGRAGRWRALRTDGVFERLNRPLDIASLALFRILFGAMMLLATLRFIAKGWVDEFYTRPSVYFPYCGFEWVRPLSAPWMHVLFVALAVFALLIAVGLYYRLSITGFFVLFSYIELIDKSVYLNHYYLISLLALLLSTMPLEGAWSLDALRDPSRRRRQIPAWCLYLLRMQVGLVYLFAGVGKLTPDWLLQGQPLRLWLAMYAELPLIGSWLATAWVGQAMSLFGAAFDLLAPFALLWRRTRAVAYIVVVLFHVATGLLFPIGVFPWVMVLCATLFFDPSWPRRVRRTVTARDDDEGERLRSTDEPPKARLGRVGGLLIAVHILLQLALPLRHWLYPGRVSWTEEGFRFSWMVMVIEKRGTLEYRVRARHGARNWTVNPRAYLRPHQLRQLVTQPDMILALAHHIARDFRRRGYPEVEVRADSFVSLNARLPQRLIDDRVDLARVSDGLR